MLQMLTVNFYNAKLLDEIIIQQNFKEFVIINTIKLNYIRSTKNYVCLLPKMKMYAYRGLLVFIFSSFSLFFVFLTLYGSFMNYKEITECK